MASDWFVKLNGEVVGPLSDVELRSLVTSQRVTMFSALRRGRDGEWTTADRVRGLFAASPSSAITPKLPSESKRGPLNDLPSTVRKCPFCAEAIAAEAIKCKHCGEFLNSAPVHPSFDASDASRIFSTSTQTAVTPVDSPKAWWRGYSRRKVIIGVGCYLLAVMLLPFVYGPRDRRGESNHATEPVSTAWLLEGTALDWQTASDGDRFLVCRDMVASLAMNNALRSDLQRSLTSDEALNKLSYTLRTCLDAATKPFPNEAENHRTYADLSVRQLGTAGVMALGCAR